MSELKHQLMLNKDMSWVTCYLKSEADEAIADLEESHKKEIGQLFIEIAGLKESVKSLILDNYLKDKEIRHHKYKRCLAMAKWCEIGAQFQHDIAMRFDNPFYIKRAEWLEKWHNRWLAIAEKFKEAK